MAWDSSGGRAPRFLNGDISVFQLKSSGLGVSSVSSLGSRWEIRLLGAPSTPRTALQAAPDRLEGIQCPPGWDHADLPRGSAPASHTYAVKMPEHFQQEVFLFLQSIKSWSVNFWIIFIPSGLYEWEEDGLVGRMASACSQGQEGHFEGHAAHQCFCGRYTHLSSWSSALHKSRKSCPENRKLEQTGEMMGKHLCSSWLPHA